MNRNLYRASQSIVCVFSSISICSADGNVVIQGQMCEARNYIPRIETLLSADVLWLRGIINHPMKIRTMTCWVTITLDADNVDYVHKPCQKLNLLLENVRTCHRTCCVRERIIAWEGIAIYTELIEVYSVWLHFSSSADSQWVHS